MGVVTPYDARTASRQRAWYVVLLLLATQIFSYIDRFLPSLLLAPIKADLELTDFQLGLMLGPAFGLFYVFIGVPIGWLAVRPHAEITSLVLPAGRPAALAPMAISR